MPKVSIPLIVFLYLFLFNPPFLIFSGNLHFGNLFSLLALILFVSRPQVVMTFIKSYKSEFLWVLYLLLFAFLRSGVEGDTPVITQHIIAFINIFIIVPFIINFIRKKTCNGNQYLIRCLLIVGAIGSIVTLLCFLSPSFNQFSKQVLMQYSSAELNNEMNDYRGYGFASLLSSDYGFTMGILLVMGCFYYKNNKWFLLFMPLVFLAALVNARTGLVIALTGILVFFIYNRNYKFSLVLLLISFIIYQNTEKLLSLLNFNENTLMWLTYEFESASDAIRSGDMSQSLTLTALFSDFWIMPDNIEQWIFGRGFDLYRNTHGVHPSDVGWIRELNYGGLLYLIPLICLIWTMFRRLIKLNNKAIALFFLLTVCIINTKTMVFPGDRSFYILVLIYTMITMRTKHVASITSVQYGKVECV